MNESLITKIRKRLTARLDQTKPTGVLCDEEMETLYALYQVLTADEDLPRCECVDLFNRRTLNQPGRLHAYREGLALLNSRCPGFTKLTMDERDAVLKKILRISVAAPASSDGSCLGSLANGPPNPAL